MFRILPSLALQVIENEEGIVRTLRADPWDDQHWEFELKQFQDPENNRPTRPLDDKAEREFKYDYQTKVFVKRSLKNTKRGLPKPGCKRIKQIAGTLLPKDGRMRLYNHATSNQGHESVGYGFQSGVNPDAYLYLDKSSVDTSQEACLITACFQSDAGTNTKWHIKGQSLNAYHRGIYPEAISFEALREHNRAFSKRLTDYNRHHHERNEVSFKPELRAVKFIFAVEDSLMNRVNAIYRKLMFLDMLKIDLPVLIIDDQGKREYPELNQAEDILKASVLGIPFAYQIHEKLENFSHLKLGVFEEYWKRFEAYKQFAKQFPTYQTETNLKEFFQYYSNPVLREAKGEHTFNKAVMARKQWSEIVSHTDIENAKQSGESLTAELIKKIERTDVKGDPLQILQNMVLYLQKHTKIVLAFNASTLKTQNPASLHYLNLSEMIDQNLHEHRISHLRERNTVEEKTFDYIPDIAEKWKESPGARPRYAFFCFADQDNWPKLLNTGYGQSYFVLKESIKLNSLFVPYNVFANTNWSSEFPKPCTYFQFQILLNDASNKLFLGILQAVTQQLPNSQIRDNTGFEMHAYIPSVNLFDSHVVDRIYISPNEYQTTPEERQALKEQGLMVYNEGQHAYEEEQKYFDQFSHFDPTSFEKILKNISFFDLDSKIDFSLKKGCLPLYEYLLKTNPNYQPAVWQKIVSLVPITSIHLFLSRLPKEALENWQDSDYDTFNHFSSTAMEQISEDIYPIFITMLSQLLAAGLKTPGRFCVEEHVSFGEFLAEGFFRSLLRSGSSQFLFLFIQEKIISSELLQEKISAIITNPIHKKITKYLVQEKLYTLNGSFKQLDELALGENFYLVLKHPSYVAILKVDNDKYYRMVLSLLDNLDDLNLQEKCLENLYRAKLIPVMTGYAKREMYDLLARKQPKLLPYFYSIQPKENLLSVEDQSWLLEVLRENQAEEEWLFLWVENCFHFQNEMPHLNHFMGVSQRAEEKAAEEENTIENMLLSNHDTAESVLKTLILQGSPLLRKKKTIEAFMSALSSLAFLENFESPLYSIPCLYFYFPDFILAWAKHPHLCSKTQLESLILFLMGPSVKCHAEAKLLLAFRPELIDVVDSFTQSSLLHLAIPSVKSDDFEFLKTLALSKNANQNNRFGDSTLMKLYLRLKNIIKESIKEVPLVCFKFFLENISYTESQLLEVLSEIIESETDHLALVPELIQCLFLKSPEKNDMARVFLSCFKNSSNPLLKTVWKAFLSSKRLPQSALESAISQIMADASLYYTKEELHCLLDASTSHQVKSYLGENLLAVSRILDHVYFSAVSFQSFKFVFNFFTDYADRIFENDKLSFEVIFEILKNFMDFFQKQGGVSEFKNYMNANLPSDFHFQPGKGFYYFGVIQSYLKAKYPNFQFRKHSRLEEYLEKRTYDEIPLMQREEKSEPLSFDKDLDLTKDSVLRQIIFEIARRRMDANTKKIVYRECLEAFKKESFHQNLRKRVKQVEGNEEAANWIATICKILFILHYIDPLDHPRLLAMRIDIFKMTFNLMEDQRFVNKPSSTANANIISRLGFFSSSQKSSEKNTVRLRGGP